MEYPVLQCKSVTMNFWSVWFPMIFAAVFGISGLIVLVIGASVANIMLFMIGIPFFLIGAVSLFLVLRTLSRYMKVKTRGTTIQATVYGYIDYSVLINGRPAQIVKLLVHTPDGPRFILYRLGDTLKRYGINDNIDITVYQDHFMISET